MSFSVSIFDVDRRRHRVATHARASVLKVLTSLWNDAPVRRYPPCGIWRIRVSCTACYERRSACDVDESSRGKKLFGITGKFNVAQRKRSRIYGFPPFITVDDCVVWDWTWEIFLFLRETWVLWEKPLRACIILIICSVYKHVYILKIRDFLLRRESRYLIICQINNFTNSSKFIRNLRHVWYLSSSTQYLMNLKKLLRMYNNYERLA